MTDNVVRLHRPEPGVWVCKCGCTTHHFYEDGSVRCGMCETEFCLDCINGDWRAHLPEPESDPAPMDETNFKVLSLTDAQGFLKRHIRGANDIGLAILVMKDGGSSTWADPDMDRETTEEWLKAKVDAAKGRIFK